jgi:hypothetical protein
MSGQPKDLAPFQAFLEKLQSGSAGSDLAADVNEVNQWSEPAPLELETLAAILGYSATANGKAAANARREVLKSAFQSACCPATVPIESLSFWGAASSAQRLYAISKFLVWMCDQPYAKKAVARRQSAQNLVWMKLQFFRDAMRFEWPQVTLAPVVRRQGVNAAFMKPLTPSAVLAVIVGKDPLPRTEVVSTLWAYIKKNGLQSVQNKRMIHADENLKKIFEKNEVSMFEMAGLIGRHLR